MMTAIMQCPNAACGRFSHLGDDPLGRIFRCPHCLAKLPCASSSAADAGWTAVVGRPRLRIGRSGFRSRQAYHGTSSISGWSHSQPRSTLPSESGEILVSALDMDGGNSGEYDRTWKCNLGPDDSSEVLIEPFLSSGKSNSEWVATSTTTKFPNSSISGLIRTDSLMGTESDLGRFRIHSLLGEGEHAVVYRAYDPILERDVALKVPRQGVLKTVKAITRFLGEAGGELLG